VRRLIVLMCAGFLGLLSPIQAGWWKTYGTPYYDDIGLALEKTTDGGYIMTGYTAPHGGGHADVYLIKTDSSGDTLWTRAYGGTLNDVGRSVALTAGGGYIVAGSTASFGAGNFDVYLIKTNASGDTLWARTYGGGSRDEGYSVQQTTDGGYVVAGYTESFGATLGDIYLVKTDALGDTLWTKTYGGSGQTSAASVQQTTDGGYIITGLTGPDGNFHADVYLVKTNAQGDSTWTRTYGGLGNDCGNSVRQTSDGGYIIAGIYTFSSTNCDVYLIKTDSVGDTAWTRTYGGASNDVGNSVRQTTDGGYIVAGYTDSHMSGDDDVYLIKTNSSGDTLWTSTFGGSGADQGNTVRQTADGGYVIAGYSSSYDGALADVYLIKTDASGRLDVEEPPARHPASTTSFLVRPNPFTSLARVPGHETETFTLSDITGRRVAVCRGDRIGAGLRPGIYFLSPVGSKTGKPITTTIIKAALQERGPIAPGHQ